MRISELSSPEADSPASVEQSAVKESGSYHESDTKPSDVKDNGLQLQISEYLAINFGISNSGNRLNDIIQAHGSENPPFAVIL